MRDPLDPGTRELPLTAPKKEKKTPKYLARGLRLGYARVSTQDQNLDAQLDALKKAGCDRIFEERASGKNTDRPELKALLSAARPGDTVVVWKLDRIGRSLLDLLSIIERFRKEGIAFESLTDKVDTQSTSGRLFFGIVALMAEYERNLIIERTRAGLTAARAKGRIGGRAPSLDLQAAREIQAMLSDPKVSVVDAAKRYGVSRGTIYNHLRRLSTTQQSPKPATRDRKKK